MFFLAAFEGIGSPVVKCCYHFASRRMSVALLELTVVSNSLLLVKLPISPCVQPGLMKVVSNVSSRSLISKSLIDVRRMLTDLSNFLSCLSALSDPLPPTAPTIVNKWG